MERPWWAGCAKLSEALGSWPATLGEVRTPQECTEHLGGRGKGLPPREALKLPAA